MKLAGLLTAVAIASLTIAQPARSEEVPTYDLSITQPRLQGESGAKLRVENRKQRTQFNSDLARSLQEARQNRNFAQPVQSEFNRRILEFKQRPFTPDPARDLPSNFRL